MPSRREAMSAVAAAVGLAAAPALARTPAGPAFAPAAPLPFPVQEIYPTVWRGRIVTAGGFRHDPATGIAPTDAVLAVAPGNRAGTRWEPLPKLRQPTHHPFLLGGPRQLFAIGGFTSAPGAVWQNQAAVWLLNPFDVQWSPGPALPQPQSEVAGALLPDGSLFITGGRSPLPGGGNATYGDQRDTGASWRLAPGAKRWETAAPLPMPRNSSAFALLGGRLHVIGGRTSEPAKGGEMRGAITNLAVHHSYDPATDSWREHAPLPAPRGGHAAAVLDGAIHVFGGETFAPTPMAFADVFRWDPRADRWSRVATMPQPRHGLGAVTAPDGRAIHIFGGAAEAGANGTLASHLLFRG